MEHLADGFFDRDFALAELLGSDRGAGLTASLGALLGTPVCLRGARGEVLAGDGAVRGEKVTVPGPLEPLGSLEAAADRRSLEAAVALLGRLLKAELRYRMASSLHMETVAADFEALKERHAALQASEERYRDLNLHLEQRVRYQVVALDAAQRRLYQTEKLASVGRLAAGMAHEINTPMGFIRSNLNTAQRNFKLLESYYRETGEVRAELEEVFADLRDLLGESLEGTERVARIVAALKDFSRVDRQEVAPADLNEVIRNAVEMVRPLGGARVKFSSELSPLPIVTCNAASLGQVLLSLLTNAVQAIEKTGRVRVRSTADQAAITIAVEDDGQGIARGDLDRIFEPFFTTREVGRGTGLGLTVSNDIVRAHGGRIEVASQPGIGTRFSVVLPHKSTEGS